MNQVDEGGGVEDEEEEVREAERVAAEIEPTSSSFSSFTSANQTNEQARVDDTLALFIPSFQPPSSFPSASTSFPSLDIPHTRPNVTQIQCSLRPPPRSRHKSRLPSLVPVAYQIQTSSAFPLTDETSFSFTPTLVASPSTLSSSLTVALTSQLSSSLSSSIAFCLSTPSSFSFALLHSSPSSLSPQSSLLHLRADRDSLRLGGRWKRKMRGGELMLEGEGKSLAGVSWEWGEEDEGRGRVGVRWLRGIVECSTRSSFPLTICPPFNRLYLHSTLVLPASSLPPAFSSASPPPPSAASVDLLERPDSLVTPSSSPHPSTFHSPLSSARLSLEIGVSANLNPKHSVDFGVGWSTSGVYLHFSFTSLTSTWSFPLYLASPITSPSSPLLSPYALAIGVPVSFYFLYSFLIAPTYRLYLHKLPPPSPPPPNYSLLYQHIMKPFARLRQSTCPSLTVISAQYGWAHASSTRVIRPSHPLFRWGRRGEGGEVRWVDVRDCKEVMGFWMREGRLVLGEGRKGRMLGMERIPRPSEVQGPLVLGVYVRYEYEGVQRHVFIGEREGCIIPSLDHPVVE